jgi:hypothetical protein
MPATLPAHPPPPDRRRWASRLSRSAWHRAIAGNQLEPLFPNVARLWGSPATLPQRALAAVWATHPGTMASHRTSAALWGVERPGDDPIDVMMPDRTRYSRVRGVVVHRPRDLLDAGYVTVHFPWKRLTQHPGRVAERIQQVLARWSP